MTADNLFLLSDLCIHYQVELPFIHRLSDYGLVEVTFVDGLFYLSPEGVARLERVIRIHTELEVNLEGIDVILNLLDQIEHLKAQVSELQTRLIFHGDL
jgi:DNA-binding PadR family transcriptional regulator